MTTVRPGVLLVTGAYYPELSGAGLQSRALVRRLSDRVDFVVITTTADPSACVAGKQDGIDVYRVLIDRANWLSKVIGAMRFVAAFLRVSHRFSIVQLHGFSQKSVLLIVLARLARKRVAIKLTSMGHDDAISMRRRGRIAWACYANADAYFAVSPGFAEGHAAAGLRRDRFRLMPNGVDVQRFRPAAAGERDMLRAALQIPASSVMVLFVGFFSREKRPDLLFQAWSKLDSSVLVYVGATRSTYYEIDQNLAAEIREEADRLGVADRLRFLEPTHEIERLYRAADIFVLPSVREGMPNALLEAMASEVPCIATCIRGVTDVVIEDSVTGLLVRADDATSLEQALQRLIEDRTWAKRLGCGARRAVEMRYSLDQASDRYLNAYRDLLKV